MCYYKEEVEFYLTSSKTKLLQEDNELKYNKKNQPYSILGRFRITDINDKVVEHCRVRFFNTKHEQVVKTDDIKTGKFEDLSLVTELVLPKLSEEDNKKLIESIKNEPPVVITEPMEFTVVQDDITSINGEPVEIQPEEEVVLVMPQLKIVAINPKGKEIEIEDLESFCAENKLNIEMVRNVLEGKQKSHKKWGFKTV